MNNLNDTPQLCISKFRKLGLIIPGEHQYLKIKLREGFYNEISVNVYVNLMETHCYVNLKYDYLGKERECRIELTAIPSNLGEGVIWYFLCPKSGKRCKILYLIDGEVAHREAFKGYVYDSQIRKSGILALTEIISEISGIESEIRFFDQKYRKKYYAGRPTKRFARVLDMISHPTYQEYRNRILK